MKISVCGKGGSGKSTLTGLIAREAETIGIKVLVVDSDESNSGLYRTLGFKKPPIPLMELVGGKNKLKEKMGQANIFNKSSIRIQDIPAGYILGQNGLRLVSIGKILQSLEGCACPMGVLNREFLKKLQLRKNEIALIDMEAGIEHFGRGVDASIDALLIIVEPSYESMAIACKIKEIAIEMKKPVWAVLNKVKSNSVAEKLKVELGKNNIDIIGIVPEDLAVFEAGLDGMPFEAGVATRAAKEVLDFLFLKR